MGFAILAILAAALLICAEAHGAEMGARHMVEWPIGVKGLLAVFKSQLLWCGVVGAAIGSIIVEVYSEGTSPRKVAMHAAVAIALTPLVIRLLDQESEWDVFLGIALILAVLSHVAGWILSNQRLQKAAIDRAEHEIKERFASDEAGK